MPTPEYPRVQRGDRRTPATLPNRHSEHLEALRDPAQEGGLVFDVPAAAPQFREVFLARITATNGSVPPAYSWTRLYDLDSTGAPENWPGPVTGTATDAPSFEIGGNPDVPVDGSAVVEMWPSQTGPDSFQFFYPALSGTFSQDVTFTGDVIWTSTSTVTVQQGAKYVFQSTSSTGTPPGELSLPTLTVAGPPTWTPPAGTYPIEYSTVDGVYWQWNGSTWVDMSTAGGLTSPLINKGDIWIHNGTTDTRLPVGTDDHVLTADSTQATGLRWQDPPWLVDPLTTLGDLLYEDTTPEPARLAGNTAATKKWLSQTGTGAVSAAPAWDVIGITDLPGAQTLSLGGTPTLSRTPTLIRVVVNYSDFTAAATTQTITLFTLPAFGVILSPIGRKLVTTFSGGALANFTVAVGITGSTGRYVTGAIVYTGAPTGTLTITTTSLPDNPTVAVTMSANGDGAHNVNTATQGQIELYFLAVLMS